MLKQILIIIAVILLVGCQMPESETTGDSSEVKEISTVLDDLDQIEALDEELNDNINLDELDNIALE